MIEQAAQLEIKGAPYKAQPPAWVKDGRPTYGGQFWINGDGARPVPKDTYMMRGAGGQSVTIIPSQELVVVRMGPLQRGTGGGRGPEQSLCLANGGRAAEKVSTSVHAIHEPKPKKHMKTNQLLASGLTPKWPTC
ncbi:MAG: hypothetical protein LH609_16360 [Rudanella sp.]|nr:hypothetical protein [Rudanella sp.]